MGDFIENQFPFLDAKQPYRVIQNVYDKYSESSRPVKLSQIKRAYLQSGKRDEHYGESLMNVRKLYPQYKKQFDHFASFNPWKQQKIQAKIRKGEPFYNEEADQLILSLPVVPEYVEKLTISREDSKKRRKQASMQLQKKHETSQKVDVAKLFKSMIPMLSSEKATEYIPAVLLTTGRRVNELANQGKIEKSGSSDWFVIFSGQSKTGVDLERKEYEIPLLARYERVKSAWDHSKKYLNPSDKCLTPKEIANKTRNILTHIKKYPEKYGGAKNLHNFRAIYAAICTEIFDRGNISRIAYVSHILGENSINPALHYSSINLENLRKPWFTGFIQWDVKNSDDEKIVEVLEQMKNEEEKVNQKNVLDKVKSKALLDFWKRNKHQIKELKKATF
jgi:hypothetical protein